jgi:hypothetical protein
MHGCACLYESSDEENLGRLLKPCPAHCPNCDAYRTGRRCEEHAASTRKEAGE